MATTKIKTHGLFFQSEAEPTTKRAVGLTARELEVLNFIDFYRQASAASPSFEDVKIGARMKSLSHAAKVIYSLEQKGWIRRKPGKWRSITLVNVAEPPPMKLHEPGYD